MLELQRLFAAPGAVNDPEAVSYTRVDDDIYIAYASGPGVVICNEDLSLHTTLAFDDAFPVRSSAPASSSPSVAGLAVDSSSQSGIIAAWRGKQVVVWSAAKPESGVATWKPISTLTAQEDIMCLDLRKGCIVLGTSRTVECWNANLKADIPIYDCIWTRSSALCARIAISPDLSHFAWCLQNGSEAYTQRLKADLSQKGLPQVLKHSKSLSSLSWRDVDDPSFEPCLITSTIDSNVRLYSPVLDDPFWFQLVASIDLKSAMRKSFGVGWRGKAAGLGIGGGSVSGSGRNGMGMPFALRTWVPSGGEGVEGATTFVVWMGEGQKVFSAEVKGLDKRPPQLVQVRTLKPYDLPQLPGRATSRPGSLRFIPSPPSSSSITGLLLVSPSNSSSSAHAPEGLAQYSIQVVPAIEKEKTGSVVAGDRKAVAQGIQPNASLRDGGMGSLVFGGGEGGLEGLEVAVQEAGGLWQLDAPVAAEGEKDTRVIKLLKKTGVRVCGTPTGLVVEQEHPGHGWTDSCSLASSRDWTSWAGLHVCELGGTGMKDGKTELVVLGMEENSFGLSGYVWRVTVDSKESTPLGTQIRRETLEIPDPGRAVLNGTVGKANGVNGKSKHWKVLPLSDGHSSGSEGDLFGDESWRVPVAFAVTDGSGTVVLLDVRASPDKGLSCHAAGIAETRVAVADTLDVVSSGLVLAVEKEAARVSVWRPALGHPSIVPEVQISCSSELVNADSMTTLAGNLLVAVGETKGVKIFCEERLDLGKPELPGWRQLASLDLACQTPFRNTGLRWLPSGDIAVSAGHQVFIAGVKDAEGISLLQMVDFCNEPLPRMHPINLEAVVVWDQPLGYDLTFEEYVRMKEPQPRPIYPHMREMHSQTDVWQHRVIEEAQSLDGDLSLSPEERKWSSEIGGLLSEVDSFGMEVDLAGMRFLVSLQADIRSQQAISSAIWDSVVWANRSATQDSLVKYITLHSHEQRILWKDARRTGAFLWITDNDRARALAEDIARNQFLAGDRNPIACSLLYFALGKKSTVLGLWRQVAGHTEQNAMLKFLVNDFTLPRWKTAAAKNAYALLAKQRYEYAAAFFVLAGDAKDAVNVCVKQLGDWQLGLAVARLMDPGSSHELLKNVTEKVALPLAVTEGSRWLLYWSLVTLGKREEAVRAIMSAPVETGKSLDLAVQGTERPHELDPALLALLADLKKDKDMSGPAEKALSENKEMRFVLACVKAYWRMGCRSLALAIMREWDFHSPHVEKPAPPPSSPKLNGNSSSSATNSHLKAGPTSLPDFSFGDFGSPSPAPAPPKVDEVVTKVRSEKAGVMSTGAMKLSSQSQGAAEFDMGSFF